MSYTENSINVAGNLQDKDIPLNWRKIIYLFLSNWYWFLITVSLAVTVSYVKIRYTLPNFSVSATLLIEEEEGPSDLLSEIRSVRRIRRNIEMTNELAKLNAFSLHRQTIDSLNWDIFWTGHGRVAKIKPLYYNSPYLIDVDSGSNSWYINMPFYVDDIKGDKIKFYNKEDIDTILELDVWNVLKGWKFRIKNSPYDRGYASYSFVIYDPNSLAKQFRRKLNYQIDETAGTVITLSSEGPAISREIDYINTLCKCFITSGLERKNLIAVNSIEFIDQQIEIIQDSLSNTEQQLLSYRVQNSVVDLSREGQFAYEKLKEFYERKTTIKLKQNYYGYLTEYIESKLDPQAIIAPTLLDADDQLLIEQVRKLQLIYDEREQLAFSVDDNNPAIIHINSRIESTRQKLLEIINSLRYNNELGRKQIDAEEKQIEAELLRLPVSEQELISFQRKYDVNNQFYTFLLQKRAEAGIKKAATVSNVRILDEASSFTAEPVGTKSSFIYLISFILGLIIPASIIMLADNLDNRIKDRADIENHTNIPILGVVSHDVTGKEIPVYHKKDSALAESFRHIRTNLQFLCWDDSKKIIMISSTISGEGKTFIATNLAAILAMNNKRILLTGFDLRRPSLHKIFNITNDKGISTYLAGGCELKDIIFPTFIEGMDVIIAGPIPPNPAELIETNRTTKLFADVKKKYDYIIIDTPPSALVTDSLLISKHADINIFVIRQNYSGKPVLELINNLKEKRDLELSLLVNDIKESKLFGYRYYYGYGYEYGYGYSYQYKSGYNYYDTRDSKTNNT